MLTGSVKRLLQLRVGTCVLVALGLIVLWQFFAIYGVYDYDHVPEEDVPSELFRAVDPALARKAEADCEYDHILSSTESLQNWQVPSTFDDFRPDGIANGSFAPSHCHPAFSVAILVPYRERQRHWDVFLPYMHDFLRRQNVHYKIYLIEQRDDAPWNKGALFNAGARRAVADRFPCLVLHDVDLLPLDRANLYACARAPRHMSAAIDSFRYVLPYAQLVGGALALRTDHFLRADGFSTRFTGWGGEDDDLQARLAAAGLPVLRFPRRMSRYTMLRHAPAAPNPQRRRILAANRARRVRDGYGSSAPRSVRVEQHWLFTLVAVR